MRLTSAFSTFAETEVKPKQHRPQARVRSWSSILLSADYPSKKKSSGNLTFYTSPTSKKNKNTIFTTRPMLLRYAFKTWQKTFFPPPLRVSAWTLRAQRTASLRKRRVGSRSELRRKHRTKRRKPPGGSAGVH